MTRIFKTQEIQCDEDIEYNILVCSLSNFSLQSHDLIVLISDYAVKHVKYMQLDQVDHFIKI